MRASDRMGLASAVAMILISLTATPLTRDWSYLGRSWLLVILLTAVGALLRRVRTGAVVVLLIQLVVVAAFTTVLAAGLAGPGTSWYDHIRQLWSAGIVHMQTQSAPMAPSDGVTLIFVTVLGLVAVLTDLLAVGLARPVWAVVPSAAVFLVPALGLGVDTGIFSFLCLALGYLAILVVDGLNRTQRWTRGLTRDSASGVGTAAPVVWRAAGVSGAGALAVALVLGFALPTLSLSGLALGNGAGAGPLQLSDPSLDLRRDLNQPQNTTVLQYQTDDPNGEYLRLASLPQFNGSGWSNVQMRLSDAHALGEIPGVTETGHTRHTTTVKIVDFDSEYLPLPYAPRSFAAQGTWAYDPNSLVVLSSARVNRTQATRDLTYTVHSMDVAPKADDLATAGAGLPPDADVTRAIPKDLPQPLINISRQVTAAADTPAEKAAAIQAYLRGGTFTYSTQPAPGSGYKALENFLFTDQRGYCEQFAAAMAMMARVVGIPSRVAIGFLPGERHGDTWDVTVHNMHAWPELYFSGYGWVRYEPTPASVTGTAPSWTVPADNPAGTTASSKPSATTSTSASAPRDVPSAEASHLNPSDTTQSGHHWWQDALTGAGALLVLLILAAPATIRIRRRSGRLTAEAYPGERVESAWAEIRDTVADYGGSWPEGASPRAIGEEIAGRLSTPQSDIMTQVATMVERSRYARTFEDADGTRRLAAMTNEIRRGIAAPQTRWRRIRALVWPRSLFSRRRA